MIEPKPSEIAFVMVMLAKINNREVAERSLCNGIDVSEEDVRRHISLAQDMGADMEWRTVADSNESGTYWKCNNWNSIKESVTGWLRDRNYYPPVGV